MTYSPINPIPYHSIITTSGEQSLAKALRDDVVPIVKRLLSYLGALVDWTNKLPSTHKGIPTNSPLSSIVAPLMLVPTWLHIKRHWKLPIAISMDNILIHPFTL